MLTPRVAWGLDIGESTVKAVKMRRTRVGAEILAFDSIERALPTDESGDKDYHLRNAIATLAARNTFGRTPIVVSIPEPAFSRFIPLPPVDKKRIPEVVRYEARQQIPFPIEEVVWDYQPVREPSEIGEETEVAIFSLRSQFVYALLANLSLCNMQPAAVLPVPLALYNFLTFDRDVAKGTIVVDLGAGSTDILICDPENFRVRNITVSGNGITRGLADRLKISHAEAEALKRECKDKVQAERLFKLILPTLNDLVGQVQRTIGFFKSQIHNVRIEQALLLGNTFRLSAVSEYFVDQLGCDLIPANVLERITLGSRVDGAALKELLPSLAVGMGLALQGIGVGRVQVNLMPRELLLRQEIAKKRPSAVVAVVSLGVMLGAHLLSVSAEKSRIMEQLEKQKVIKTRVAELDKIRGEYKTAKGGVSGAVRKLDEPASLSAGYPAKTVGYRGCIRATNALNKVLDAMSEDIIISRINVAPKTGKFTREQYGGAPGSPTKTLPAVGIRIEGRTKTGDLDLLGREFKLPLQRAKTGSGPATRPQFVIRKYDPDRVPISPTVSIIAFTMDCDFLITD